MRWKLLDADKLSKVPQKGKRCYSVDTTRPTKDKSKQLKVLIKVKQPNTKNINE